MACILGLNEVQAKASILHQCKRLLLRAGNIQLNVKVQLFIKMEVIKNNYGVCPFFQKEDIEEKLLLSLKIAQKKEVKK